MVVDRKSQELLSGKPITDRLLDPILLRTFLDRGTGQQLFRSGPTPGDAANRRSATMSGAWNSISAGRSSRATQHSVALTPDGEALVGYAQNILDTCERAERYFAGTRLRGTPALRRHRGSRRDVPARHPRGLHPPASRDRPRTHRRTVDPAGVPLRRRRARSRLLQAMAGRGARRTRVARRDHLGGPCRFGAPLRDRRWRPAAHPIPAAQHHPLDRHRRADAGRAAAGASPVPATR